MTDGGCNFVSSDGEVGTMLTQISSGSDGAELTDTLTNLQGAGSRSRPQASEVTPQASPAAGGSCSSRASPRESPSRDLSEKIEERPHWVATATMWETMLSESQPDDVVFVAHGEMEPWSMSSTASSWNALQTWRKGSLLRERKKAPATLDRLSARGTQLQIVTTGADVAVPSPRFESDDISMDGTMMPQTAPADQSQHYRSLLPLLLPAKPRGGGTHTDAKPLMWTQPHFEDNVYTQLGERGRQGRRLATPESLQAPGAHAITIDRWEPRKESVPHYRKDVRHKTNWGAYDGANSLPSSLSTKNQGRSDCNFRKSLAKGDWGVAADSGELLKSWPESWRQAASRRAKGKSLGLMRLDADDDPSSPGTTRAPVTLAKITKTGRMGAEFSSGFQRMYLVTTRLVKWMVECQRDDLLTFVQSGLNKEIALYKQQPREDDLEFGHRWTVRTKEIKKRGSKPAQHVTSDGEALMDNLALHSVFAHLAGYAEGGVEMRAKLAQAGPNIDRVYDSMLEFQNSKPRVFELSQHDARMGLCFDAFFALIGRIAIGGPFAIPRKAAKNIFAEFAGNPGIVTLNDDEEV